MTPHSTEAATKTPLPIAMLSAWYAPTAAFVFAGAAMARWQMCMFEAWREIAQAPHLVTMPAADADTLKVAIDNAKADAEKDETPEKRKNEKERHETPPKSESDIDEELEESFPASDPPSHNPGVAVRGGERD